MSEAGRLSFDSRYEDALDARRVRPCTSSLDCACMMRLSVSLKPIHCRPTHATWIKMDCSIEKISGVVIDKI